jgi:7-cyano-7-deazaguanine synthase
MASEHDEKKALAVVLVSGGLDSCVTAAIAQQLFTPCFLHVNYGQRTEARERQAYSAIADHYQTPHRLEVSLGYLKEIGGSSLTDSSMAVTEADLASEEIPSSYVPFRNANLLSVAVSWAEVLGAQRIFIGAVGEDASGYPDCRPVFYEAFNAMISTGTKPETDIQIETPIIFMSKAEIVRKGIELAAPIELTWSCYQGGEDACGVCDSCAFRLRGFQQAGVEDPLPYATRPDYCS